MSDLWDKLERAYDVGIEAPARRSHFLILLALVITFGIVRAITHAIRNQSPLVARPRPGDQVRPAHPPHGPGHPAADDLSGYLALSLEPGTPVARAAGDRVRRGLGLTLDEFALWLNLEDVYWQQQGRESIDAVIVAASLLVVTFIGLPFWVDVFEALLTTAGMQERAVGDTSTAILVTVQAVAVLLAVVAIYKGKRLLALVGVFVPLVALTAAVRLAKPRSRWARRFYDDEKIAQGARRGSPPSAPTHPWRPPPRARRSLYPERVPRAVLSAAAPTRERPAETAGATSSAPGERVGRSRLRRIDWWRHRPHPADHGAGVVYVIFQPRSPDLAAHIFRADLFGREGFTLWNGQWYGGHHTPGLLDPVAAAGVAAGPAGHRRAGRHRRHRVLHRAGAAPLRPAALPLGRAVVRPGHGVADVHQPDPVRDGRRVRHGRRAWRSSATGACWRRCWPCWPPSPAPWRACS